MIYIGKFLHTTSQQEKKESDRRHGEFNLIITAEDKKDALAKFKERIIEMQASTDLFEGKSTVYLEHVLEMKAVPKGRAVLFNFQSVVGDPVMPSISCQAPSGDTDGCKIVDWQKNRPGFDGSAVIPFMNFGNVAQGRVDG
jgi:hypothetical protein